MLGIDFLVHSARLDCPLCGLKNYICSQNMRVPVPAFVPNILKIVVVIIITSADTLVRHIEPPLAPNHDLENNMASTSKSCKYLRVSFMRE